MARNTRLHKRTITKGLTLITGDQGKVMITKPINKTLCFNLGISICICFLMIGFCTYAVAYVVPVAGASDFALQNKSSYEEANLSSCKNNVDITNLENYAQTFVVITPKGCLTSDIELNFEKVIPKLPLPTIKPLMQGSSSEVDEDLRISFMEEASDHKRFGILKLSTWWLFATIAFMNTASPGGAVLLTITTSLSCGFSRTYFTTIGHLCAIFLASAIAVFGLGFILDTSSYILLGFKFFAAAYLIYLGISQWKSKVNIFSTLTSATTLKVGKLALLTNGFLVGILNPHTLLFFTAFTPKILDTTKSLTLQFIVIAGTYMAISFFILISYAGAASSVKRWFARPRRAMWFRRVSGAIFVTLGLGVLRLKAGLL